MTARRGGTFFSLSLSGLTSIPAFMMMPKRSGFLVLEKLKTLGTPIKVIMITANEGSRHKAYAKMLGVHEYLRKPFAMDKLLESVERLPA